jgi:hypothetical protein
MAIVIACGIKKSLSFDAAGIPATWLSYCDPLGFLGTRRN